MYAVNISQLATQIFQCVTGRRTGFATSTQFKIHRKEETADCFIAHHCNPSLNLMPVVCYVAYQHFECDFLFVN